MRVLQLISSGGYYGAESMLVHLSRSLAGLGCQSVLGAFRNTQNPHLEVAERVLSQGLPVEIIACDGRVDRTAIGRIREIIARRRIDLVHTHGSKPNAYAWAALRGSGIPLVATYHLDWPDRGVLLHLYHLLDRALLRSFRRVVGVSPQIVESLRRGGVPDAKLAMIDNGIEFTRFAHADSGLRAELGAGSRRVVGVAARLTRQKGHEYLLRAIPKILARRPDTLFVFAGDGPLRPQLEWAAEAAGITEYVRFLGSRDDMPAVYAGFDVFVLPSINEGMPMAIIEALAAGLPVVATNVGAVAELIRDGETGLLVEPGDPAALADAVSSLLENPSGAIELARAGQAYARRRFSAESMARRYLAVYGEALSPLAAPAACAPDLPEFDS